jgi:mRNA interferase RelE/StbE
MTYKLLFKPSASKEWDKLDNTIKSQFKKVLLKRIENPHIPSARLSGMDNCYKIKLRTSGYRLVYQVKDAIVTVEVISVNRRDGNIVYEKAIKRL